MLEIHCNVVTTDVRGHGDDRCVVELSDQMASRNTVKVGHDDVHQHKIVFCAGVHLVDCFQAIKLGKSQQRNAQNKGNLKLTALSTAQWKAYKNLPPIRLQVWSSSTSSTWGCLAHPGSYCMLFFLPSAAGGAGAGSGAFVGIA